MKKTYAKPDILFESFSMCTNIASCAIKTYTPSQGDCGFDVGGPNMFLANMLEPEGCQIVKTDGDPFCYHVPTGLNNLFNS